VLARRADVVAKVDDAILRELAATVPAKTALDRDHPEVDLAIGQDCVLGVLTVRVLHEDARGVTEAATREKEVGGGLFHRRRVAGSALLMLKTPKPPKSL
jgi:hypothetical protein